MGDSLQSQYYVHAVKLSFKISLENNEIDGI
jgi:hypothetical protein